MVMNNRKMKILKAIINSYIDNGEAVGSRTISKRYDFGISPATIRNEMSDLEEMGFLIRPHTSAGRIPTDKAYRYYVDSLGEKILPSHINEIRKFIQIEVNEIDLLLKNSARILSQLTRFTSFIVAPQLKKTRVKRFQLVPVTSDKILLVIIMQNNIIRNIIIQLNKPIPGDQLNRISKILTEKLSGYRLEDIDNNLRQVITEEIYSIKDSVNMAIRDLIPYLIGNLIDMDEINLYSDGITNILNFPEYNDLAKAKEFISFMEDKNSVIRMFQTVGKHDLDISIGSENRYEELKDSSLITATYKLNGRTIGKIGVIGPTRMDYKNVISMVKSVSNTMNEIIEKNFSDKNKE